MDNLNIYVLTYAFTIQAIVESSEAEQDARDRANQELSAMYGPDMTHITEFRLASPEEIETYNQRKAEYDAQKAQLN